MRIKCTQDILAEDIEVVYGVGMSIGSISPGLRRDCIKDMTFRRVNFDHPLKAIYIKTNPGDEGSALVQNITFTDITMKNPVWWGIYIGPQ